MRVKKFLYKDTYQKLIKYAVLNCDIIMFVANYKGFDNAEIKELDKNMNIIEEQFKSYFIKYINRPQWIFSEKIIDIYAENKLSQEEYDKLFKIYFYKLNDKWTEFLLSNQDLYSWLNPKYPEDIAFFKGNVCWLSVISHEELCEIFIREQKEYDYLKSIGIEFYEESFQVADAKELYYEKALDKTV